jgi:aminopeptidase N
LSELATALEATARAYRAIADRVGTPYPSAEYTQVFVDGSAAQEAAGIAFVGRNAFTDLRADPQDDWVFAHELAHQWFGWLLSCADFADFWLNEGFATFFVGIAKEARWGPAAYARELSQWRARSQKAHATGRDAPLSLSAPGTVRAHPVRENELQARGVTYFRGALALDALRRKLGEDAFWAAIRRYVKDNVGKSVRTENLKNALEAATSRDLEEFFARSVYSADTFARVSSDAPVDAARDMYKPGTR